MTNKFTRLLTTMGALLVASVALQGSAAAQVTVFADINYSGNSRTFNGDVPNMTSTVPREASAIATGAPLKKIDSTWMPCARSFPWAISDGRSEKSGSPE